MTADNTPPPSRTDLLRQLTNEEQDPVVVETMLDRVQQILTTGETVIYVAVQKKPVVNLAPECVVLTNRRFIVYRAKLLGQVSFEDHPWRDLQDVKLGENFLGATLTFVRVSGAAVVVDHLPKAQARRLYAHAQEMEERVREERRERELEDKRAAAGGVVLSGLTGGGAAAPATPASDPVQRLKTLKEMHDAGLITAGEFEAKRAEIIAKM